MKRTLSDAAASSSPKRAKAEDECENKGENKGESGLKNSNSDTEMTEEELKIYDRQLRVWGLDAQKRYDQIQSVLFERAHLLFVFLIVLESDVNFHSST